MALPATVDTADKDMTLPQVFELGKVLHASGYFNDIKSAAQAVVKILRGRELGIGPVTALEQIHVVQGKTCLSAGLVGALIKRSGRYDYRILRLDDTACEIAFYDRHGKEIGRSKFSMEDARKAGLHEREMWRKYPRNLLFARALLNGARWYCPDVFGGAVYSPEELSDSGLPPEEISPIEVEPIPEPVPEQAQEPVESAEAQAASTPAPKPNGRALGAQKALFGAVEEWAKKTGFDPDQAKADIRAMLRQKYEVQSCSDLTPEQWTEAAKNRAQLLKSLEQQYISEAKQVASA